MSSFSDIGFFIIVGFLAQLVDGAIGMAYGLIGTSTLLSFGVPPAVASASIHAAEVFTTFTSGISHWRLNNIHWPLVRRLVPAGMLGGALGAYILATQSHDWLTMIISIYLFVMGVVVLRRGLKKMSHHMKMPKRLPLLGFVGGLLDAIGGGGWGPLVNSHLLGVGIKPRKAIGSTSLSEFFITFTISCMFLATIGLDLWPIITGLIIGGVMAAPLAAYVARLMPPGRLLILVGIAIMALSLRTIIVHA